MKALLRGFLTGFGFALGASVAGTLIGYTIGRIGEASVKRLLSPEPASSPTPPTSSDIPAGHRERLIEQGWRLGYAARGDEQETDEQRRIDESRPMTMTETARYRPNDHQYLRKEFVGHCVYEVAPGTVCGWDEAAHHNAAYGATMWQGCTECGVPHSSTEPHVSLLCNCGAGEKYGYANRSMHDPDCRWRIQWVESWRGAPTRPADWDAEAARETMHHSPGAP